MTTADVGFGLSQLLPILVAGLRGHGSSILCVEQPETHLHPKFQGDLADFLCDTAMWNEDELRMHQWIIETHSEALIVRLQRRIREKKIPLLAVKVLYVEPMDEGGSEVRELRLDDDGEFIDEWPHGFFEETFVDRMA